MNPRLDKINFIHPTDGKITRQKQTDNKIMFKKNVESYKHKKQLQYILNQSPNAPEFYYFSRRIKFGSQGAALVFVTVQSRTFIKTTANFFQTVTSANGVNRNQGVDGSPTNPAVDPVLPGIRL